MSKVVLQENFFKLNANRHPWIFRNSLAEVDAASGDIVDVFGHNQRLYGRGFYSAQSQISVRMITYEEEPIEREFWRRAIEAAATYRKKVVTNSNAYRLISSEADRLPGVIADVYDDHLVIQTLCPGADLLKDLFVEEICAVLPIKCVVERNDPHVRTLEGLEQKVSILKGTLREDLEMTEGSRRFHVDPLKSQKTGAYLDQRDNRLAAGRYAKGRVLDAFCYQGGFAIHEAVNCDSVLAVDSSREALDAAEKNAILNQTKNIEFRKAKAFDVLNEFKGKEEFDVVSIDPPAFAKSRKDVVAAERAYYELNQKGLAVLKPEGILITSSCSYHMTEEVFLRLLQRAAGKQRRTFRILEKRTQALDHPILISLPESYYLKCFVLQMI